MEDKVPKEKEITFTFKVKHLKQSIYYLVIVVLVVALVLQYFYPSCSRCPVSDSQQADVASESSSEPVALESTTEDVEGTVDEVEEEVDDSEETIEDTAEETVEDIENDTVENETIEESEEELVEEDLPITGEVFLTIGDIDYLVKGDDYARVQSVTFTIKNQDVDFVPRVVGYLTWDLEDTKEASLDELEAGRSITATETKLTFGYKDIDQEKKLILKVYDKSNKLKASAEKTFMTS